MRVRVQRTELGLDPASKQALVAMFIQGESTSAISAELGLRRDTIEAILREVVKGLIAVCTEQKRDLPELVSYTGEIH